MSDLELSVSAEALQAARLFEIGRDTRMARVRNLWDRAVSKTATYPDFEGYLSAAPDIPFELLAAYPTHPHIILVEPRFGLTKLCRSSGVDYKGDDHTLVARDESSREFTEPTWIRVTFNPKNANRAARECRDGFDPLETGLTALQGVCAHCQIPGLLGRTPVLLPGSSLAIRPTTSFAYMFVDEKGPVLHWEIGEISSWGRILASRLVV